MASPSKDICTLCKEDNVTSVAVTWCTECGVFLCVECEKHHKRSRVSKDHKRSRVSKDHKTISVENYQELPSFIKGTSNLCKVHDSKFELYCSFHACACCVHCTTDKHQLCQTMTPLSDILKQFKSSAAVPLLEKDLKDLKENVDEIVEYLRNRQSSNSKQKTEAIQNIRSMRKSIDDYLNQLEQQLLKDLEIEHSKLNSEMETLLHKVDKRGKQIRKLQNEFSDLTKYATELQTYVGLREIEKITTQEGNYIEDLKRSCNLNESNLHVTTSPALVSFLHDIKLFGEITIDTGPCNVLASSGRNDQAQYIVPVPMIDQIKPSLLNTVKVPKGKTFYFAGCCILPNGNFIALNEDDNSQHNMAMFKNDGTFIRNVVSFKHEPHSVCFIRDDTVAVTLYHAHSVAIIDVKKNHIIKNIDFSDACYGIASDGKVLAVALSLKQKVIVLNLQDESKHNLKEIFVHAISFFNSNMYASNWRENKVYCYTRHGKLIWTFAHEDINSPAGITFDQSGFIYIACRKSNRIVVVSPDGKSCKTVLTQNDGIEDPRAIAIDRETGIMVVLSRSQGTKSVLFKL